VPRGLLREVVHPQADDSLVACRQKKSLDKSLMLWFFKMFA
jgi:hypothetical protein